jgi:hypothetical protein
MVFVKFKWLNACPENRRPAPRIGGLPRESAACPENRGPAPRPRGFQCFSACPDYSVVKGLKGVRGTRDGGRGNEQFLLVFDNDRSGYSSDFRFQILDFRIQNSNGQSSAQRKPPLLRVCRDCFFLPRIHEYRIILLCIRACVFCYYEEMKMLFHSCIRGCFFHGYSVNDTLPGKPAKIVS